MHKELVGFSGGRSLHPCKGRRHARTHALTHARPHTHTHTLHAAVACFTRSTIATSLKPMYMFEMPIDQSVAALLASSAAWASQWNQSGIGSSWR